jgi:hypothetical protein
VPPATIHQPGATHEICVTALHPDRRPTLNGSIYPLTPINFAGQFIASSDEDASQRTEAEVVEVINGVLSPDTDFIGMWIQRFGDSNIRR